MTVSVTLKENENQYIQLNVSQLTLWLPELCGVFAGKSLTFQKYLQEINNCSEVCKKKMHVLEGKWMENAMKVILKLTWADNSHAGKDNPGF